MSEGVKIRLEGVVTSSCSFLPSISRAAARFMPALDYQESIRFLYERINYERVPASPSRYPFRLHRMAELCGRLGLKDYLYSESVQPPKPIIHVAGTKGKGSTTSMVASILSAAGYKTGLYTSPHLHTLEERFRINRASCLPSELVELVNSIREVVESMDREEGLEPTFFELTTAMSILYFHQRACDAIVLETGLGGRLDSTNVFAPSVTAITSIGLDHQHVLGDTIEEIAFEKAGIIKPSIPVVSGVLRENAAAVIQAKASLEHSPIYQLAGGNQGDFSFEQKADSRWGSDVHFHGRKAPLNPYRRVHLAMEGEHQARNASIAIAICDLLISQGLLIPDDAFSQGLAELSCSARIERFELPGDVTLIIDAAHNEDSLAALIDTLRKRFAGRELTIVFGTSRDKSAEPMLAALAPLAKRLILTQYNGNPRFREASELQPMIPKEYRDHAIMIERVDDACHQALKLATPGGVVVVCGSFFLAAEAQESLSFFCQHPSA